MSILTVAIPTFNRKTYLEQLLSELIKQRNGCWLKNAIELLVVDNNSTDETNTLCNSLAEQITYYRNPINIGGDANFLECVRRSSGRYIWLFGDDELLRENALNRLMLVLTSEKPQFLIAESDFPNSRIFDTYKALLECLVLDDPIFPVHHTLITRNVFLKTSFDFKLAEARRDTNYGHMYALINHLSSCKKVYLFSKNEALISIREERAPFAEQPVNLEKKLMDYVYELSIAIGFPRVSRNVRMFYNYRTVYKLINGKKISRLKRFFRSKGVSI